MLFTVGLLLECVCIFGLFVPYVLLIQHGTPVTLETQPIDPRSIFRGDYVTLGYLVGRGVPNPVDGNFDRSSVYVILERQGDTFQRVGLSDAIPQLKPGQACLRGQRSWGGLQFPDIAQYFVPEGLGQEVQNLQNAHLLLVDAVTDEHCKAVITGLRLGEEANAQQLEDAGFIPPSAPAPTELQVDEVKGRSVTR